MLDVKIRKIYRNFLVEIVKVHGGRLDVWLIAVAERDSGKWKRFSLLGEAAEVDFAMRIAEAFIDEKTGKAPVNAGITRLCEQIGVLRAVRSG